MALVAETTASAIIEKLVDTVLDYASLSWWPSSRSVKAEAEKLQAALPQIRLILAAVQGDQIRQRNSDFDARLWQFRDALEAADDVLDEIKYYELEEKIKAQNNEVSGTLSGYKRKLVNMVKHAFVNDEVLNKLRETVKGLEAIASDVGPFLQLADRLNQQLVVDNFRETGSFFIENRIVGREKEKEMIVRWLTTQPRGEGKGILSAYTIFGIGGMGKTTLAQLVCNEERVAENFELIMWVCVSDNYGVINAKTIIKNIIEDISKQSCNLDNLNTLQGILKKNLASKKFLLVLDDVWRDDTQSEWEKILAPLRFGVTGSKILLTTRMESVVNMIAGLMEAENQYLNLTGLEENDFMSLFYRYAFEGTDPNKHPHLHEIGKEITRKLWACPLAAKVIGGVLNKCFNFEFWNKILNEDILNIEASKDYIMEILKLSYYHLPIHLQLCFRYCSIFPQDYRFRKAELVKMWIGSGLIPQYEHEKKKREEIANEYLDQLTRKSFFNRQPHNNDPYRYYYIMHDLLHDLARCVSEGECLRIKGDDGMVIPRTIRHLSIETENYSILRQVRNLKKLHTFIITFTKYTSDAEQELNDILSEVKRLRVLSLVMRTEHKMPNRIKDLIHLRYLIVQAHCTSREQFLGFLASLYRLYHLEVMEVHNYAFSSWNIQENEMEGVCNLINLRYLWLPGNVIWKIPWIGKLHSLQVLYRFDVRNDSGYKIGELRYLNDLQKLCVYRLNEISNPDDVIEAKMDKKENLQSLSLNWCDDTKLLALTQFADISEVREKDAEVADNLKPSLNLNELTISYYFGTRSPYWMNDRSYRNLTYVKLVGCYRWEHLPPLGQLHSLECLKLYDMKAVKQVGYSLYGDNSASIFPSLRELEFLGMPELEEWIGVENKLFFPHLEKLLINKCPKLKRLPTMPPSLRRLEISDAGLNSLPGFYQAPAISIGGTLSLPLKPSLTYLKVWDCPNITTLDGCPLLKQPNNFHTLKEITIRSCINLLHMPMEALTELPSLTDLTFGNCPKLVSRVKLPTMLKNLNFGWCGDLEPSFLTSLQDLTSLTVLVMHDCENIQCLPPTKLFARLAALHSLEIRRCKDLSSLSGIEELTALRKLGIWQCEKLNEFSLQQPPLLDRNNQAEYARHLELDELRIDCCSLLMMEPLRSLMFTRSLEINRDLEMTSLPEQWLLQNRLSLETLNLSGVLSLQSLPPIMESMCSLQHLTIYSAKLLKSLPNLPATLISLEIYGCHPELEDLCRKETDLY
ncbi:hypothetical protein LUZ60_014854 [Juncus effusus]|nr:hypothetical protein LUZ60_014854 [Juncus effusus]